MSKDIKNVKNQHFVPQAYLNQFTNSNGKCCVYNKKRKISFLTDKRNILAKRYFYDINFEDLLTSIQKNIELEEIPHPQILEKIFCSCENNYKLIQENILNNTRWFRTITNRFLVYQLIAIQLMRTPSGKKIIRESFAEVVDKNIECIFENILLLREIIRTVNCEEQEPTILEFLLQSFGRLTIGINNSDIPFITSDTPMFIIDNYKETGKQVLFYPITPNRCILLHEQIYIEHSQIVNETLEKYKEYHDEISMSDIVNEINDTYRRLKKNINPLEESLSLEDVKRLNVSMFIKAEEYIVSNISIEKSSVFSFDLGTINKLVEMDVSNLGKNN